MGWRGRHSNGFYEGGDVGLALLDDAIDAALEVFIETRDSGGVAAVR